MLVWKFISISKTPNKVHVVKVNTPKVFFEVEKHFLRTVYRVNQYSPTAMKYLFFLFVFLP